MSYQLSKSSFIKSVQCLKYLFFYKNAYYLKDKVSVEKQQLFQKGHEIGSLARELFPGGVDASKNGKFSAEQSAELTRHLIDSGTETIFEATFVHNEVLIMLDVLLKHDHKWYAYEVKSAARITRTYILDASLQYYVVKNCLPELEDFLLITINPDYVFDGNLKLEQLFRKTSVLSDVSNNLPYIEHKVQKGLHMLSKGDMPPASIGAHCFAPYECDFIGTCWKNVPSGNVFELSGIAKSISEEWYAKGIKTIAQLEETTELPKHVQVQISAHKQSKAHVDEVELDKVFSKIHYPLCFFDVEVFAPAIPYFNETKPYQALPFLYSIHAIGSKDEDLQSFSAYLEPGIHPFPAFVLQMVKELSNYQSIVVYDSSLELQVLNQIAKWDTSLEPEIRKITSKFIDLSKPIKEMHFYDPSFRGASSLKAVYQRLFSKDDFDKAMIASGYSASVIYANLLYEQNDLIKKEQEEQLVHYCQLDTKAIYAIFMYLNNLLHEKIAN